VARSQQTDLAVLGGLSVQPMSGYALREVIREVLGHFWSESFGQIYPALRALERDGHVERAGATRGALFTITDSGRRRLRELLSQPVQKVPPRNGLLLRLFLGRTLGVEDCRNLIASARADAERELAGFDTLLAENAAEEGPDAPFIRMTILAGRHAALARVAWADECRVLLEEK
jgi:DNA-binding PadR family transcriptional regulator